MARPSKAKAIERLRKALERIPELKQKTHESQDFEKWWRDTRVTIEKVFVDEPQKVEEFTTIRYWSAFAVSEAVDPRSYHTGLESATVLLESMIEEIQEYWEDEGQEPIDSIALNNGSTNTREIFIIHGRDNEAKQTVARFLEQLKLETSILHEQPNQGLTIIEKFEKHAQVGFAVALLTPDDIGAFQEDTENLKSRARQNVVFEFGYFIGRLGRKKVCALVKGDVEIPSDYAGVIYISLDNEDWQTKLVRELKGAGIDVDANLAF